LFLGAEAGYLVYWKNFFERMRELGWTEGQNIIFERRFANDMTDRLLGLAAELVQLNVDAIYTTGTVAPLYAKRATLTIPIVFAGSGDPVGTGLVASLARPGGNITGFSSQVSTELATKRLQLIKDVVPALSRLSVLREVNQTTSRAIKDIEEAARPMGITIHSVEVRTPADFDAAHMALAQQRPDAMLILVGSLLLSRLPSIADIAVRERLPSIATPREFAEAGGLMTYGVDVSDLSRRAAGYVDRILRGASPSDLPVQQPTQFRLVINLRTAKAIGVEIPAPVLAQAAEVLE
jgi:putative ABC transport system substrate-binding protein